MVSGFHIPVAVINTNDFGCFVVFHIDLLSAGLPAFSSWITAKVGQLSLSL